MKLIAILYAALVLSTSAHATTVGQALELTGKMQALQKQVCQKPEAKGPASDAFVIACNTQAIHAQSPLLLGLAVWRRQLVEACTEELQRSHYAKMQLPRPTCDRLYSKGSFHVDEKKFEMLNLPVEFEPYYRNLQSGYDALRRSAFSSSHEKRR